MAGIRQISTILASAALASTAHAPAVAADAKPRLAVLMVVDQFGSNLLKFHRQHLTGGLDRLIDQGRYFPNAVVDHAPTNSLPGHLSAASGAYPRRHGVVDNGWVETAGGRAVSVSGFVDPSCRKIEPDGRIAPQTARALGPGRFEAATIVEWVLRADPAARFASVGTGGGVSALHAGRARGPVLWFDSGSAGYVSSTCYLERLPAWALQFNRTLAAQYMEEDWRLAAPAAMTARLRPDAVPFENGGRDTAFPHVRPEPAELARWFDFTPFTDEATLGLARAAVTGERLGSDEVTDILTIGLSSLDHVGHRYGPFSVEQADTLHRLDRNLAAFFDFLDERVGKGEWVLALTADHGAPAAPEDARRFGVEGAKRISEAQVLAGIETVRSAAGPDGDRAAAAEAAGALDFVDRVIRVEDLARPDDPMERLYANSWRPGRVSSHPFYENAQGQGVAEYGIIPIPPAQWVVDWATSIHGSPYAYDRQVPVIFYGAGIDPGVVEAPARTIDVAPTLASLLGIKPVAEVDGRTLEVGD